MTNPKPPVAGWNAFDASQFRNAIHFVMGMAAPVDVNDQVTFHWNPTATTSGTHSGDGVPFDPSAAITSSTPATAQQPYVLEWVDASGEPTAFGEVVPSHVRVWLLDVDYAAVKTADYVVISGDKYVRHLEQPPYGLFDVGIHVINYSAVNET